MSAIISYIMETLNISEKKGENACLLQCLAGIEVDTSEVPNRNKAYFHVHN